MTPNMPPFLRERTHLRHGAICWYPFAPGASALDLSDGALTGWLERKCGRLDSSPQRGAAYDYIVAFDPPELGVGALLEFRGRLKAGGRLLMAYENPFALRFWAGRRPEPGKAPYESLFGRAGGPSKAEMSRRLAAAGFPSQKWYYPMTDHWLTTELYSDAYLPNEMLNQRGNLFVYDDPQLQFCELPLYREAIRNGAFEFMCPAYLVEAGDGTEPCAVDYAAVTIYREPSRRFATAVRSDGTVRKTALHGDAEAGLARTLRNHEELASLGVRVLPLRLDGDSLVMERLDLPTILDCWAAKLAGGSLDEAEFVGHYDRIRDAIRRSAAGGRCYWELVPANCFYDAAGDDMIFFDQEFCWDGLEDAADVALARAILGIYYGDIFGEDSIRMGGMMEKLKSRYGLASGWDRLARLANEGTREVFGDALEPAWRTTGQARARTAELRRRLMFAPLAERLRGKTAIVYGYGRRGKRLCRVLEDCGAGPAAVVDRGCGEYRSLGELPAGIDADMVIVSILDGGSIAEGLRAQTGLPVYTIEELLEGAN
ncbi:MAG: hypothetical protein LBS32_04375 [Clostridiales Family XIII bacterium]|jgi:hypothetical protein|nr:hypothetical protein [Clostridiales Family XIII bacterium]